MRILHVVPTYIPAWRYGGPIHSVHGLCKALAARGHEVTVATTNVDGAGTSNVSLTEPVEIDGVHVRYFESPFLRRLYFSPTMKRFLARATDRCDVVHTHAAFLWPPLVAARLAVRARRPLVVSPRGMLVGSLIARRSTLAKRAWIRLFEARTVREASAVHVTSEVEAHDLLALGLAPRELIEIPNGVDFPAASPASPASEAPGPYVLFLGRISWKKGIDRLVCALPLVPSASLVVAGPDDEGLQAQLEAQARRLGVSARVRFTGPVEGPAKDALLRGAATLALASHSENFGNAVLEAMAHGVPVVVTPEVGLAQLVAKAGGGIVASGEPAALADALRSLVEDEGLRRRLGTNARAAALAYSWSAIAERMEAAYARLAARNPLPC